MCMCDAYAVLERLLIWQMFCIKFRILFSYSVVVLLFLFMLAGVATFLYNGDNNLACSGLDETIACNLTGFWITVDTNQGWKNYSISHS